MNMQSVMKFQGSWSVWVSYVSKIYKNSSFFLFLFYFPFLFYFFFPLKNNLISRQIWLKSNIGNWPLSATSYRRCAQLSDAIVSKQLLLQKKVFDKNCRGTCELQRLPEKFCYSTEIKKDIRSKKNFQPSFYFYNRFLSNKLAKYEKTSNELICRTDFSREKSY